MVDQTSILPIGLYHFQQIGNYIESEFENHCTKQRQDEIQEIVNDVAEFEPTCIAVGIVKNSEGAEAFQERYELYLKGELESLSNDEQEQFGFRLGARFGHARLHPVYFMNDFPLQQVLSYAQRKEPNFFDDFYRPHLEREEKQEASILEEATVKGRLMQLNNPLLQAKTHSFYIGVNRVGSGDTYVGSSVLESWYSRHIRILANIQQLCKPGGRVILFITSGHVHILRQLIDGDPKLKFYEALDFL